MGERDATTASPDRPAAPRRSGTRRGISLQERVFRVLEEQLLSGAFATSGTLPSEDALAASFAVSRVTIRAALARLEQDGRIHRVQGRGTLVTARAPGHAPRLSLTDVLSDMESVARATSVQLVAFDYRPAPADVALMLGLPDGAPCQYAVRLRAAEGRVILHLTTYIPEAIGRRWTQADLASTPLQTLLRGHNIVPVAGYQVVTAALATPEVAERTAVELGTPMLRVLRSYSDAAGQPIQYLDAIGPAHSFELRMSLRGGG